jgi:hypothetical protein
MALVRHEGKPTSGRYVYARRGIGNKLTGGWLWQCDLCGDDECVAFGASGSMQGAFAQALEHTRFCLYSNRVA